MEITNSPQSRPYLLGIPRKPLDSLARPKPSYASDDELTRLLASVLRDVPRELAGDRRATYPLLDALMAADARRGANVACQLIFIAAANHRTADERRTAEYLLRHRVEVADGRRSVSQLLLAARGAAEMDLRRVQQREMPVPRELLASRIADPSVPRCNDPSVGEIVVHKLRLATGDTALTERCITCLLDAVPIALTLAQRHVANPRRKGPSLLAMRADARKDSRLVTHLRAELGDAAVAGRIARLLVGPEGSPIESALLWWSARPDFAPAVVPQLTRNRWLRDLRAADRALASRAGGGRRRQMSP